MSDGGIAQGFTFWATFNIVGNLDAKQLKQVTNDIRQILNQKGVNGDIVHSVRMTAAEQPVLSISMKESSTLALKLKAKRKKPAAMKYR
jgi:hypothetical protein